MSKEPEKKAAEQGGSEIEYAFGRVPADKRKTFSTILVILVGYCIPFPTSSLAPRSAPR